MRKDDEASKTPPLVWDSDNVPESLKHFEAYARSQASDLAAWYYRKKSWKKRLSIVFRLLTIIFTAAGGIIPVLVSTLDIEQLELLRLNQLGYISIGLAGLFLSLDRFTGSSTGWMRFISTAMAIETLIEEFKLDWIELHAKLGDSTLDNEHAVGFIERLKNFTLDVRAQAQKETETWIAEFQANLSRMEKETNQALEKARAEMKKQREVAEESQRPGAINLTLSGAGIVDRSFTVELDDEVKGSGVTNNLLGISAVKPGLRKISVKADDDEHFGMSKVVEIGSNEIFELTFDIKKK